MIKELQKLGLENLSLNDKELKTYLTLLELGEGNIAQISKKSGIKRTTSYDMAKSLVSKGFASQTVRGKKNIFIAEDPRKIADTLEEKTAGFKKMLPELLSLASTFDKKPIIKMYEGSEGLREIYKDMLAYPGQEITGWFANDYDEGALNKEWFFSYYGPKRLEKKISVRAIMPDTKGAKAFKDSAERRLTNLKFVSPTKLNIPVPISIYGGKKIAIVSDSDNIGVMIESQKIHDSLKSIFELAWENA